MDLASLKDDRQMISVPARPENHFRLQLKRQQPIRPGVVEKQPVLSRLDLAAIQQSFQRSPRKREVILQLINTRRWKRKLKAVSTLNSQERPVKRCGLKPSHAGSVGCYRR